MMHTRGNSGLPASTIGCFRDQTRTSCCSWGRTAIRVLWHLQKLMVPTEDRSVGMVEASQLPIPLNRRIDPTTGEIAFASTAGVLVCRDVIIATEGFDSTTFSTWRADIDFSWRARRAGYRVVHRPSARVFHDRRLTSQSVDSTAGVGYSPELGELLMLAWKYSRPDLCERWVRELNESPIDMERTAAARNFRLGQLV